MVEEENLLERALRLAAADPAFIPEFYGTLLDSEVFILGTKDPHAVENVVDLYARAGSHIHIQHATWPDGSTAIPFFTSLPALQLHIERQESYLRLAARDLFELTRGEQLFLNPASEYAKSLSADEIGGLLRDGLPTRHTREVVQEDTPILMGKPATPTDDITNTLSRFFKKDSRVAAAYMAMIQMPETKDQPSLCVGVECDPAHYDDICPAAMATISHLLSDERQLLVFHVDPQKPEDPGAYMREEVTPFYSAQSEAPPATPGPSSIERRKRPALSFGKRIR